MPVFSNRRTGDWPDGYDPSLPPEADVNVAAMRAAKDANDQDEDTGGDPRNHPLDDPDAVSGVLPDGSHTGTPSSVHGQDRSAGAADDPSHDDIPYPHRVAAGDADPVGTGAAGGSTSTSGDTKTTAGGSDPKGATAATSSTTTGSSKSKSSK